MWLETSVEIAKMEVVSICDVWPSGAKGGSGSESGEARCPAPGRPARTEHALRVHEQHGHLLPAAAGEREDERARPDEDARRRPLVAAAPDEARRSLCGLVAGHGAALLGEPSGSAGGRWRGGPDCNGGSGVVHSMKMRARLYAPAGSVVSRLR